jgi:hypothetical protein
MIRFLFSALLIGALGAPLVALSQKPASKDADKTRTLNGCITREGSTPSHLTFSEAVSGDKYHLTGRGLGKYAGRKVEIVGGAPRFTIRGGLWPSPNVAAQAGALDPAQMAIASRPGGSKDGTGTLQLPEFHVVRVRPLEGACR